MKKYRVYVLIFVLLLASGQFCDAVDNTVTIIAEGTYIMGDGETPGAAEQRAFENAKRSAIEQAGVYVESYSQTKNMQLSQDEVNVISSGLVQSTIIDKKRTIEGEGGFRFWCKVSCIIKLDTVESMKARLGDKQSIDQYKDLQAKSAKLEQDLFDLKAQMKNATSDTAKKATEAKIAQNEKQASILDMLARAYQLNVAGDFDSAIVMLTKILTEENNAEAYYYRGWDYSKKGQHDQAITDYSQAIKLKPDFVYAYAARGISYKANGQIDPAIADYSQAIRLKPNDVSTYFNRGNAYADKGQSDQAIADYSKAIKLKPDFVEAYNNRGNACLHKKQYDQAIADYSQAIKLKPDFVEAYTNRGLAYTIKGQSDQAITDYSQTIKLKPDFSEAYYFRGNEYLAKGQNDQAIADYSHAVKLKPDYARAYYKRGLAYDAKGQLDQAIADYSQTIKLMPNYADAYNVRGLAYMIKGQYDQAKNDFRVVRQLDYNLFMKLPQAIRNLC